MGEMAGIGISGTSHSITNGSTSGFHRIFHSMTPGRVFPALTVGTPTQVSTGPQKIKFPDWSQTNNECGTHATLKTPSTLTSHEYLVWRAAAPAISRKITKRMNQIFLRSRMRHLLVLQGTFVILYYTIPYKITLYVPSFKRIEISQKGNFSLNIYSIGVLSFIPLCIILTVSLYLITINIW